jgi:hypothetical protein
MATDELLQAEARERKRVAVLAGLAALFTLLAAVASFLPGSSPSNLPASLLFYDDHEAVIIASAVLSAIGSILLVFVLDFLFRATRLRSESLPSQLRPLAFIGGFGIAAFTITLRIILAVKISHFATHGTQTYDEAKAAADFGIPSIVGLAVQLAFSFAIVIVAINAMRVGLLPRFLGYLGAISGALFVLPLVPVPIVQIYWLGALAMLLAGRARSGTPAAWERGEAVPWPSGQELRELRIRAAEERRGGAPPAGTLESPQPDDGPAPAAARRKRKKRR